MREIFPTTEIAKCRAHGKMVRESCAGSSCEAKKWLKAPGRHAVAWGCVQNSTAQCKECFVSMGGGEDAGELAVKSFFSPQVFISLGES